MRVEHRRCLPGLVQYEPLVLRLCHAIAEVPTDGVRVSLDIYFKKYAEIPISAKHYAFFVLIFLPFLLSAVSTSCPRDSCHVVRQSNRNCPTSLNHSHREHS